MTSSDFAPIDNLRHRLTQPGPWAERLRRLAQDIAHLAETDLPSRPNESPLTCDECDAVLDQFVDGELDGPPTSDLSQRVWSHLRNCARCQLSYSLLVDTLVQESAHQLPDIQLPANLPLSFLVQPSSEMPWTVRLRSQLTNSSFGLTISFGLAYLRTLLAPPQLLVRAEYTPTTSPTTHVLLSDQIMIGDQLLAVEVSAIREPQRPDWLTVQSVLAGAEASLTNVWAKLTWAGDVHLAPVNANGVSNLGEVSIQALLSEATDFEIAFEVRESSSDPGQPSD